MTTDKSKVVERLRREGRVVSPIIAAAAMAASSVNVIGNALRLKRVEL